MIFNKLLCAAAIVSMPQIVLGQAAAPSGANDSSPALEEVIVSARRVAESQQTTPVAMTTFSSAMLADVGAVGSVDLSGRSPNVQIIQGGSGSGAVTVFVRGVGLTSLGFNLEAPVGTYIDDVYMPRLQGALVDLVDLDQIEILRGPQGTLYGRDSTVGALKYVTAAPNLNVAQYTGELTLGEFQERDVRVGASVPLIAGEMAVKVDAVSRRQEGYLVGVNASGSATGARADGTDRQSGRVALLWVPGKWRVELEADIANDNSGTTVGTPLTSLSGGACRAAVAPCRTRFNSPYLVGINSPQPGFDNTAGVSAHVSYDFDWADLKSISAYRNLQEVDAIDLSSVPGTGRLIPDYKRQNQESQELQLVSKPGGKLSWVTGLFYFREGIFHSANFLGLQQNEDDQTTNSYAAYADLTYAIIDGLHLNLGGRYTDETRAIDREVLPATTGPATIDGHEAFTETKFTYQGGLDYAITSDVFAYATYSTGFRPGSFSSTYSSPAIAPVVFGHTNAETAANSEVGLKTEWLDHRVRLNVDFFHTQYENLQTQATIFPFNVTATNFTYQGEELELQAKPLNALTIFGNMGLLSASTNSGAQLGMRPKYTPSVQYSLGAEYRVPLPGGNTLFLNANNVYTSEFTTDPSNLSSARQSAYNLVGAQIGVEFGDGKYKIAVVGKNITDSVYFQATALNAVQYYAPPRTIAVTFSAHL